MGGDARPSRRSSSRDPRGIRNLDLSHGGAARVEQLGWIPFMRYAWAFNFWRYLPGWAGWMLAAASFLLCFGAVRNALIGAVPRLRLPAGGVQRRLLQVAGFAGFCLAFWLLRERQIAGDSVLLLVATRSGSQFLFPEMGATFLMWLVLRITKLLGFFPVLGVQLMGCVAGSAALLLAVRLARQLGSRDGAEGRGLVVVLLIFSGGMIRVFAGHIENYAVLLATVTAYLWLALAHLDQQRSWVAPSLVLGVAIWLHMAALCLVPSLAALPFLAAKEERNSLRVGRAVRCLAVAAAPSLFFVLAVMAFGQPPDVERAWKVVLETLGLSQEADAVRWWVRGWGGAPSVGTDVVFLSLAQLKYLGNSAYVLVPFAVPALGIVAAWKRGLFMAGPTARFLVVASVPLVVYAFTLRPFWGPFDWDLFAISVLCLSALAAHLLAAGLSEPAFRHVAVWCIGFQLLFVSVPFLVMGLGVARDAGPFSPGRLHHELDLLTPGKEPPPKIAPWL